MAELAGDPGTDIGPSDGGGGKDWLGFAGKIAPGLGGLVGGLFASNPYEDPLKQISSQIPGQAAAQGAEGSKVAKTGLDTLGPVLAYLKQVTSGDTGQLAAATLPERATVLRQYDTARQGAKFLPRGGGQSAAMLDINARQASDLSSVLAKARTSGMTEAAGLGKDLLSTGVQEERGATDTLASALGSYAKLQEQQAKQNKDTGSSIGGLIATGIGAVLDFL